MPLEIRSSDTFPTTPGRAFLFSDKVAMSLMTLLTGVLLKVCGFVEGQEPSEQTVTRLRLLYVVLQAGGLFAGALFMLRFPITPERAAETRRQLEGIRSREGGSLT